MSGAEDPFKDLLKSVESARKSNSEAYDKAILSLSSAGLALSLSFHKTIVPIDQASNLVLLKVSWAAFLAAIIATIVSFRFALIGLDNTLEYFMKKYKQGDQNADPKNRSRSFSNFLDWVSAASFVLAVTTLVLYVFCNV